MVVLMGWTVGDSGPSWSQELAFQRGLSRAFLEAQNPDLPSVENFSTKANPLNGFSLAIHTLVPVDG
jgi:hypothetical protein